MKVNCVVCGIMVEEENLTVHAITAGLPSPCCKNCLEVRDYSDKNIEDVAAKSYVKLSKESKSR